MIEAYPKASGPDRLRIVTCPACGAGIDGQVWRHFASEHGPEDFGLGGAS